MLNLLCHAVDDEFSSAFSLAGYICLLRFCWTVSWCYINYRLVTKHTFYNKTRMTEIFLRQTVKTWSFELSYTYGIQFLVLFLVFFIFVIKNSLRFCFPSHFSPIILFARMETAFLQNQLCFFIKSTGFLCYRETVISRRYLSILVVVPLKVLQRSQGRQFFSPHTEKLKRTDFEQNAPQRNVAQVCVDQI